MRSTILACAGYVLASIVMTWPLTASLASRLPYDLGDPLLVCWVLAWQARQLGRLASGDFSVLPEWADANIFYPATATLGLSEGLFAPALLGWPVFALTGNIVLTYNLLFLAAFVLSGLGMYLWVRELTGSRQAAWLAGLLFAFAPFRFEHGSHLQSQFACWMPFVLWQVERLVRDGRWRHALAGGIALAALNLSNGYYMFFFAPWVGAYALLALWRYGQLRVVRRWVALAATMLLALALTLPAMLPHLAVRATGQARRSLDWLSEYSAVPASWFTATPWLRVWGWMELAPRPEGHLFPGAVPFLALALVVVFWRRHRQAHRTLVVAALVAVVLGVWWSFGPHLVVGERRIPGIYLALYRLVPGFDALRVPSRIATVVALWTSVLAGIAVVTMKDRWPKLAAPAFTALASGLILVDTLVVPMRMHDVLHAPHYKAQDPYIPPVPADAPLARALSRLPEKAVIVELPFGPLPLELRYMYTSIGHWRKLVNGYSGDFPRHYNRWRRELEQLPQNGDRALQALRDSGATHVVVHGEYVGPEDAARLDGWLRANGAARVDRVGPQLVYRLPKPSGS